MEPPKASLWQLVEVVVNHFVQALYADVPTDGTRVRKTLELPLPADDLCVRNTQGENQRIGSVRLESDFFHERVDFPARLHRYRRVEGDASSVVEVVEAEVEAAGQRVRFEMLVETDGQAIAGGKRLQLRTTVLGPIRP